MGYQKAQQEPFRPTRRRFIRAAGFGVGALATASFNRKLARARAETVSAATSDITFYVVLHALCALWIHERFLEVLIPEVGLPGHRHIYKIGKWKEEIDLPRGKCSLLGVPGAIQMPADLDQFGGIPAGPAGITRSGIAPHCSVTLPFPARIYAPRRAKLITNKEFFSGKTAKYMEPKPTKRPELYVLAYQVPENTSASVDCGINWAPPAHLHIFAEPDHRVMDANHVSRAFQKLTKLFSGMELLRAPVEAKELEREIDSPPPELPDEQLKNWAERKEKGLNWRILIDPVTCERGIVIR